MPKYLRIALVFLAFICISWAAAVGTQTSLAGNVEHWVSVDRSELEQVAPLVPLTDGGPSINDRVERTIDGIGILRLTDAQLEDLSRAMHEQFHKCGGFVEHSNEAEAVAWIERMRTARSEAPHVVYSIDNRTTVTVLHSAVTEASDRQTIVDLSAFPNRRYNQQSGLDSANWIFNRWTALAAASGRNDTTVEFFTHPANVSPQPSIIFTIRGSVLPNETVVLGAHQDSINQGGQTLPAPGADDDASGIACLTEVIRVLMLKNFKPIRTIQFMAYAAEEVGLRGSAGIATSYRNANKNVIGVMQLDMTNYRGTLGWDMVMITDFTDAAQNQFLHDLVTAYQPGLLVTDAPCGYACSDHASWFNRSYPASFPFEAPIGNDNPNIHTANDTLAFTGGNANFSLPFTKLGLSYVAELGKGCLSRRVPCNATDPARPALALTTTKRSTGSMLLDASSF